MAALHYRFELTSGNSGRFIKIILKSFHNASVGLTYVTWEI